MPDCTWSGHAPGPMVLDDSIVNIALPSVQRELGVSAVHLPWVVNAYILAFGARLLLGAFTLTQLRRRSPLVPLSLFRDRNRSGAYLTMLLVAVGPVGTFYVITCYLQQVLQYSPLRTGIVVIAATQAAVHRVDADKAGIASALLNSAQQIGVALGLPVLAGIAAAVSASPENMALPTGEGLVAGYGTAMTVASGLLLTAAALASTTLSTRPAIEENTPETANVLSRTRR